MGQGGIQLSEMAHRLALCAAHLFRLEAGDAQRHGDLALAGAVLAVDHRDGTCLDATPQDRVELC